MGATEAVNVHEVEDVPGWFREQNEGVRRRHRLRDVRLPARDHRRLQDRPQRRPGHPLRHPLPAGGDRRRGGADLQEPDRAGAERPQDLRDLVQDPLDAGERRRGSAPADHPPLRPGEVRRAAAAARSRRGLQDRPLPQKRQRAAEPRPRLRPREERDRVAPTPSGDRQRRWAPADERAPDRRSGASDEPQLRRSCEEREHLQDASTRWLPAWSGGRDGGSRRGARALLEQLPGPGRPPGGDPGRRSRAWSATAPAPRSVRFICGTFEPHLELEAELAALRRHGGRTDLCLLLERQRGGDPDADGREHGHPLRRAEPREHHRRHPPRAPGPQGHLQALRHGRAARRRSRRASRTSGS